MPCAAISAYDRVFLFAWLRVRTPPSQAFLRVFVQTQMFQRFIEDRVKSVPLLTRWNEGGDGGGEDTTLSKSGASETADNDRGRRRSC